MMPSETPSPDRPDDWLGFIQVGQFPRYWASLRLDTMTSVNWSRW